MADKVGAAFSAGEGAGVVVSCSALKASYRDHLRQAANGDLQIVFLHGANTVLEERLRQRADHFMPAALLQSQLDTLEIPAAEPGVIAIDVNQPLFVICDIAARELARAGTPSRHIGGDNDEA